MYPDACVATSGRMDEMGTGERTTRRRPRRRGLIAAVRDWAWAPVIVFLAFAVGVSWIVISRPQRPPRAALPPEVSADRPAADQPGTAPAPAPQERPPTPPPEAAQRADRADEP